MMLHKNYFVIENKLAKNQKKKKRYSVFKKSFSKNATVWNNVVYGRPLIMGGKRGLLTNSYA